MELKEDTKICSRCDEELPKTEFYKEARSRDDYNPRCRHCAREDAKNWRLANKEKCKETHRKYYLANKDKNRANSNKRRANNPDVRRSEKLKQYFPDLNPKQRIKKYEQMFADQNGICKICSKIETAIHPRSKKPFSLSVDHNHITGEVRGLLCTKCNHGLGLLNVDAGIEIIYNVLNYLKGDEKK